MKKVLFLLAVLLGSNMAFAQLSKGSLLVTGSFSGYKGPNSVFGPSYRGYTFLFDPTTTTTFSLTPQVSYFITNRLSVGLEAGYLQLKRKTENERDANSSSVFNYSDNYNSYTIGQTLRYTIPLKENLYIYFQQGANYNSGVGKYTSTFLDIDNIATENKQDYDVIGYSINLKPGIQYFVSNRVALDLAIEVFRFNSFEQKNNGGTEKDTELLVNLIPNSVTLGLSYRFGGTVSE